MRTLTLQDAFGQTLVLSYDVLSRSVRVCWTNEDGIQLLDVFREGATRLSVTGGISVDFHLGECAGVMDIQVTPALSVRDRLLFR
ncbi:hypothetical protein AB0D84_22235 [Streptomyces sp. NPDC048193]|uniref:hypothetical protein n=1 Tax=unclassified Streptomyces TaxID=2593676 RepID=UPI0034313E70